MKTVRILKRVAFCSLFGLSISFMASCGTPKNFQNQNAVMDQQQQNRVTQDVAVAADPCDEYAMLDPVKRASGIGTHFKEATATNLAQTNARANLAKALQTMIMAATKTYAGSHELFTADDTESASITDQSAKAEDFELSLAKGLVKGAPIVKKSRYKTPNNQWKIFVCVEMNASIAEIAAEVAKSYAEKLTPEQKTRIDFDAYKFEESLKEQFENYSGL